MKRIINTLDKIITAFFALSIIFGLWGAAVNKAAGIPLQWLLVIFGACTALFCAYSLNRLEIYLKDITVYRYRQLTAIFCGLLIISQTVTAIFADFTPINDLEYVCAGARNMILGKDIYDGLPEYHQDYFLTYPNNHFLFMTVFILYKAEFMITGEMSDTLPTILNIFSLAISYWLMCRCAEYVHTPSRAFVCAVRGMLFTPFITYSAFFYTDSLAMPLITSAVYFYLKFRKHCKIKYLILCGITLGAGFKMKGSSGILLIAILIDCFISDSGFRLKETASVFLPFIAANRVISDVCLKILNISRAALKESRFPLIHWIMMSADGRGGYNSEDFLYTQSFSGTDKISADLARLTVKLKNQGFFGFIAHLADKIAYTWENFTFMAGYYYNGSFSSPVFSVTAFICHFTILFSVLLSMTENKNTARTFLFRLCLSGICIFLLIWETRCRYLVSFFPVILLI